MEQRAGALAQRQTVQSLVQEVARQLGGCQKTAAGGKTAFDSSSRLPAHNSAAEARELVAALLDVPRHWPLLRPNKWVEADVWRRALQAAAKRAGGAPLAYAVGRANFRHLTLAVDERVLIPRPETELLVDLVLRNTKAGVAVDVGTGSGAIALALATEGTFARVIATDVSLDAIDVARGNAERIVRTTRVEFAHGSLLEPVASLAGVRQVNVIVSNPPYISFDEIRQLPRSVRDWEPALALLSGGAGMSVTARLIRQSGALLAPRGVLAIEVDARRASLVAELVSADDRYGDVSVHLDLSGRERFVLATRRDEETRS